MIRLTAFRTALPAVIISLVFHVSGVFMPFVPLPLVVLAVLQGRRVAGGASAVAVLFAYALYRWLLSSSHADAAFMSTIHFSCFVVIAFVLAEGYVRAWGTTRLIGFAALMAFAFLAVTIGVAEAFDFIPIVDEIKRDIVHVIDEAIRINKMAAAGNSSLDLLVRHREHLADVAFAILPAMTAVGLLLVALINVVIAQHLLWLSSRMVAKREWRLFRLPDGVVWALLLAALTFLGNHYVLHLSWLMVVASNLMLITGFLYFLQGLAVVAFWIGRIPFPLLRGSLYALVFVFLQTTAVILMGIGLAEVWIDFRGRSNRRPSNSFQNCE